MEITVLRKMKYKDRMVYVMQFDRVFQYLFADGEDIYQDHIIFRPNWFRNLLWKVSLIKSPYYPHDIEEGEQIILSGALATIDKITDPAFREKQAEERREKARKLAESRGDGQCQWQSRQGHGGNFYWMCLVHGKAVSMKEGEHPAHD